jgi:hypothetical protein
MLGYIDEVPHTQLLLTFASLQQHVLQTKPATGTVNLKQNIHASLQQHVLETNPGSMLLLLSLYSDRSDPVASPR